MATPNFGFDQFTGKHPSDINAIIVAFLNRVMDPATGKFNVGSSFEPVVGGHSANVSISGATTLTPPAGASQVLIQAITQNIRYTLDGTTPTSTIGFQMRAGDPPVVLSVTPSMTLQVIQESATASLQYVWGK